MSGTVLSEAEVLWDGQVQDQFRNPDTEYTFMAYCAKKNPSMVKLVSREWFADSCMKGVYDVLAEIRAIIPPKTMFEELKQRRIIRNGDAAVYKPALIDMYRRKVSQMDDGSAKVMAAQIMRLADSRRIAERFGKVTLDLEHFDLERTRETIQQLAVPMTLNDGHGGEYLEDYHERLEVLEDRKKQAEAHEDGETGILTGITRFDSMTGGMMPGEFAVVAGATGVGKTSGIMCFGLNAWAAGHNVMIVSGELSRVDMEFMIDSNLARVPRTRFRKADLEDADYQRWDRVVKEQKALHSDNTLWVASFTRKFDIDEVRAEMVRAEETAERRIDVLILDYINIMSPRGGVHGDSSRGWENQADVVWEVKEITSERRLVTWTVNQVVDAAFSKELFDISDLKYGRVIGETAPIVAAFVQSDEDQLNKVMKFQILKMRSAPPITKPILLYPNLDYMLIDDSSRRRQAKTLGDDDGDTVDVVRKQRHVTKRYRGGKMEDM